MSITETYKALLKIFKALPFQEKQPRQPAQIPPSTPELPKTPEAWKAHWIAQGQEWRTEPEISAQRQGELVQRRAIKPDEGKGIYPFGGVKQDRADVEWLLATHEDGCGPIIWNDERQRKRKGLDLRGADLSSKDGKQVNLAQLPLSRLIGGLFSRKENEKIQQASIHLEGANLRSAHLEGANLNGAYLKGVDLWSANLEGTYLWDAHLEGASLNGAHLENADLWDAHLQGADLFNAHLEGANLFMAHLEGVGFWNAHLEGTTLSMAHLEGAYLRETFLADTYHTGPRIVDVQWGDTNLAIVDWSQIVFLQDEYMAKQKQDDQGDRKTKRTRLAEYKDAARANRQLAVALQAQGISEDALRFAYRAHVSQKAVFWFQMLQDSISLRTRISYLGSWLFSWFMFLIAGYGYRFGRTFVTYLAVISGFATMYYLYGIPDVDAHGKPGPHHLSFYEAIVVSMTAFHGRGFSVGTFSPGDPQALVAAIEAFLGLLIEVIFIATLTRRLFTQ